MSYSTCCYAAFCLPPSLPALILSSFLGTTVLSQGAVGNQSSPCTVVNSQPGGGAGARSAADGHGIMETSKLITLTNDFLRK